MKALIIVREKDAGWLRDFFPATHPAMIPVCNKPLIEYHVDFALLAGCNAIRIVVDEESGSLEDYFQRGERLGVEISCTYSKEDDSIDSIVEKNSSYCADTPLLIMDGFFFLHYDKATPSLCPELPEDSALLSSCSSGSVLFASGRDSLQNILESSLEQNFALSPLTGIDDIFSINMQVLQAEQAHYVLPGYGVDQGVLLGQNVAIGRDTEITPPVIIGDNVRLPGKSVIGPDVAIGSNVIVDSGSTIRHAVVFAGSYIGQDLTVTDRIIAGKRIISPADNEILDVHDGFLISPMELQTGKPLRRITNSAFAALLFFLQLIPYLILSSIRKVQGTWRVDRQEILLGRSGASLSIAVIANRRHSIADKLFAALALERFPLLRLVVAGRMQLVGNLPLSDTPSHRKKLVDFPDYLPGIYGYSEGDDVEQGGIEEEIAERYHAANRGFRHDFTQFVKIVF